MCERICVSRGTGSRRGPSLLRRVAGQKGDSHEEICHCGVPCGEWWVCFLCSRSGTVLRATSAARPTEHKDHVGADRRGWSVFAAGGSDAVAGGRSVLLQAT